MKIMTSCLLGGKEKTQYEVLDKLEKLGFCVNQHRFLAKSPDEILEFYDKIYDCRCSLGYEIDGVVLKLNSLELHNRLGNTNTAPRWAIAYKFPAACGKTKLKKIVIQVGRTVVLTPIAELEPINIEGVLVSRASLHNYDKIKRKDIREGDIVTVIRAGDVIPYIAEVDKSFRSLDAPEFEFPKVCPECGSGAVHKVEDEAAVRCTNEFTCKAQAIEKLKYFISQEAFDIVGLADKQIEFFYNIGLIQQVPDIFTLEEKLKEFDLEAYNGWEQKSIANLLSSINIRRTISLDRFICSLGIRFIGEYVAKLLAHHYRSFDNWYKSMLQLSTSSKAFSELVNTNRVGEKIVESLRSFFAEECNVEMLNNLVSHLQILSTATSNNNAILNNKTIVFTGELLNMSRNEAKAKAESLGAHVSSSVSSKIYFLVVGQNPGSKYKKALNLGVKILSEGEWCKILSN
ncbi:MAG: DNA ligase [Wolbachia endosymbiont of Ctenocephalides orientis wCori]|nr:MAG: DNA ligase [Wolbachia endosymbiont of Ctenocephalides orientis wCori]